MRQALVVPLSATKPNPSLEAALACVAHPWRVSRIPGVCRASPCVSRIPGVCRASLVCVAHPPGVHSERTRPWKRPWLLGPSYLVPLGPTWSHLVPLGPKQSLEAALVSVAPPESARFENGKRKTENGNKTECVCTGPKLLSRKQGADQLHLPSAPSSLQVS